MRRWVKFTVVAAVLALLVAACGVPSDRGPRDIPSDEVLYSLLDPSTTTAAPQAPEQTATTLVYLIGPSNLLAPVQRSVVSPLTVDSAIASLIQGATAQEQAQGLRSAINQQTAVLGSEVTDGVARIDVSSAFSGIGAQEQILALAQLVYTATEIEGISAVQVLLDSATVEVPRSDGTLTSSPLTRADYASLSVR